MHIYPLQKSKKKRKKNPANPLVLLSNHQGFINAKTTQIFLTFGRNTLPPVRTKLYSVRKGKSWSEYFLPPKKSNQNKKQQQKN